MSDILDQIKITNVDGSYKTWIRTIDFDYEGISYRVTFDYHDQHSIMAKWLDKSQNEIEEPAWLSDDDGTFYSDLGEETRDW